MGLLRAALGLAVLAMLCGCERAPPAPAAPGEASGGVGYLASPEFQGVAPAGGGRLEVIGAASPGAKVRLSTPAGESVFATADAGGAWRVEFAPSAAPRVLGLSMLDQGRIVEAKGYLFLAPEGVAARLSAGGGSEVLQNARSGLSVAAMDYDTRLAATISGRAAPNDTVSVRIDGIERGQASADAHGVFVLPLSGPLTAGDHDVDVLSSHGAAHLAAAITAPPPLGSSRFQVGRKAYGWRIDWVTPGGGEQTTLVFEGGAQA